MTERFKKEVFDNQRRKELLVFSIVFFVRICCYIGGGIGHLSEDSGGYIDYSFKAGLRSPLYPLVIDVFQFVMRDGFVYGVSLFQIVLSGIALAFLYKSARLILEERHEGDRVYENLPFIITIIYGVYPNTFIFDTYILTESFSMSITIFFIYSAIQYIRTMKAGYGGLMVALTLAGFLTKTALFVFTGDALVLIVILFFMKRKKRKDIIKIACAIAGIILFYAIYVQLIYINTGIRGFSILPPRHDLVKVLQSGLYKNYPDQAMVAKVDEVLAVYNNSPFNWGTATDIINDFGLQGTSEFNRACINSDRIGYLKYMLWFIFSCGQFDVGFVFNCICENAFIKFVLEACNSMGQYIKVWHLYMLCLVMISEEVLRWIREKAVDITALGIWGGLFTVVLSVPLGCYTTDGRTLSYVFPFAFLALVVMFQGFFTEKRVM